MATDWDDDTAAEPSSETLRFGTKGPLEANCAHCGKVIYLCVVGEGRSLLPPEERDWLHKYTDALLCGYPGD
jgi:hypothetical protein